MNRSLVFDPLICDAVSLNLPGILRLLHRRPKAAEFCEFLSGALRVTGLLESLSKAVMRDFVQWIQRHRLFQKRDALRCLSCRDQDFTGCDECVREVG